jgi:4-hydroxybenzoyl-CoA thioesterase
VTIFAVERALRFGDCDPSGIAYFPSYLNILNGVVEEFWTRLGHPWPELMGHRRISTPTVRLDLEFKRPSRFGDSLTFELSVKRIGRSSLDLSHRILSGGEIRWSAAQTLVATSLDDHRSCPWPDDVRAALEHFMSAA